MITGLICGVGVLPVYQRKGIGKDIIENLVTHCKNQRVFPQLMCEDHLIDFYENLGFKPFTTGMTYPIERNK